MVYDNDWDKALRDDFPVERFAEPLKLTPEDRIRTTCTWNNTTAYPILFPARCARRSSSVSVVGRWNARCDETGRNFRP